MATINDLLEELAEIKRMVAALPSRTVSGKQVKVVNGLSEVDDNLGLVSAGEFRAGNNEVPGQGFSGVRIAYPAMTYDSEDWHIAGVSNDTLQFGLRASDGAALFGGGANVIDEFGIHVYDSDDDPAFIALSAAETINSESLADGDVLLGDNSSSNANILWDESAGQLKFRGGTVMQAYVDTDGSIFAGGGSVKLDQNGVHLDVNASQSSKALKWTSFNDDVNFIQLYGGSTGSSPNRNGSLTIQVNRESGGTGKGNVSIVADGSNNANAAGSLNVNGAAAEFISKSTTTDSVFGAFDFTKRTTGTPANGLGIGIAFNVEDSSEGEGTEHPVGGIDAWLEDVTDSSEDSRMSIWTTDVGASIKRERIQFAPTEIIVNRTGRDNDFRVDGDTVEGVFKVDAGLDVAILNSVKTTTGDHTGQSGMLVINEFDNNIKMYADGAWRTLASW